MSSPKTFGKGNSPPVGAAEVPTSCAQSEYKQNTNMWYSFLNVEKRHTYQ